MNGAVLRPGHRRGVHDVPLVAAGQHARYERAHAVDHAPEIHTHHPLPVGQRVLVDGADHRDAGVVADHVGSAERGVGLAGEPLDVLGAGDIDSQGQHGGRLDPHRGRGGVEGSRLDVGHDDLHALGGEPLGERQPDPARGARDDCDPVSESLHGPLSYQRCENR
jgi:hypothetical protein